MYFLLSSTRYDETLLKFSWNDDLDGSSPFFLLPYHFDRLIEAAERHGWQRAIKAVSYDILKKKCYDIVSKAGMEGSFKVGESQRVGSYVELLVGPHNAV